MRLRNCKNICEFFEGTGSHASHHLGNANVMISQFSASKFLTEFMQTVDKINVQYHPGFESDRLVCATFHLTGSTIARDHVFTQI